MSPAPSVDVPAYCRIHAKRMEAEGWGKTALVLGWAADEIERLRGEMLLRASHVSVEASAASMGDVPEAGKQPTAEPPQPAVHTTIRAA